MKPSRPFFSNLGLTSLLLLSSTLSHAQPQNDFFRLLVVQQVSSWLNLRKIINSYVLHVGLILLRLN